MVQVTTSIPPPLRCPPDINARIHERERDVLKAAEHWVACKGPEKQRAREVLETTVRALRFARELKASSAFV